MLSEVFSKASRCVEERTGLFVCVWLAPMPLPRHKEIRRPRQNKTAQTAQRRRRNAETKRANMLPLRHCSVRSTSSTPFDW